jgi:hypothetical protein
MSKRQRHKQKANKSTQAAKPTTTSVKPSSNNFISKLITWALFSLLALGTILLFRYLSSDSLIPSLSTDEELDPIAAPEETEISTALAPYHGESSISFQQLNQLLGNPLADATLAITAAQFRALLNMINNALADAYHGPKLAKVLQLAKVTLVNALPAGIRGRVSSEENDIILELVPGIKPDVLRHETIHANFALVNKETNKKCPQLPHFFANSMVWAAPFSPHTPEEMHYYVSLIQKGVDKVRRVLDILQQQTNGHAITKKEAKILKAARHATRSYKAKKQQFPAVLDSFPDLQDPANLAALRKGGEIIIPLPIHNPAQLIHHHGKAINLPFRVTALEETATAGIGMIHGEYHASNSLWAYLFDTLAFNAQIPAHQQKNHIEQTTEMVAYLGERQSKESMEYFFPEVVEYDRAIESGDCPRPH